MTGDYDKARDAYRSFGAYLRSQRQLAQLTLRQLAELSSISNPYLSQIERGLHQPSVAVVRSIAEALNLSADALLAQVAGLDETEAASPLMTTESAIRADALLTSAQKAALLSVYRSMIGQADGVEPGDDEAPSESEDPRSEGAQPSDGAAPENGGAAGDPPPGAALRPAASGPAGPSSRPSTRRSSSTPAKAKKPAARPGRRAAGSRPTRTGKDDGAADPSE